MKKKILMSGVFLMLLAGSAGAEEKPQYFSVLQGVQAESLSSVEMEQIKGAAIDPKLLSQLYTLWKGIGKAALIAVTTGSPSSIGVALKAAVSTCYSAYLDYKAAKISAATAQARLNETMKQYNLLRQTNPKLPPIKI